MQKAFRRGRDCRDKFSVYVFGCQEIAANYSNNNKVVKFNLEISNFKNRLSNQKDITKSL